MKLKMGSQNSKNHHSEPTIILLPFGPKMGHSFENTINETLLAPWD
jgi:hypothetical protein